MKGSCVQAVVRELRGEKIQIVPLDADPARFVCDAIAPPRCRGSCRRSGDTVRLIVPDDKLSLAIARKCESCGWPPAHRVAHRIDSGARCAIWKSDAGLAGCIPGVTPDAGGGAVRAAGARRPRWLNRLRPDWLSCGIGSAEAATRIIDAAAQAAEVERARAQANREAAAASAPVVPVEERP